MAVAQHMAGVTCQGSSSASPASSYEQNAASSYQQHRVASSSGVLSHESNQTTTTPNHCLKTRFFSEPSFKSNGPSSVVTNATSMEGWMSQMNDRPGSFAARFMGILWSGPPDSIPTRREVLQGILRGTAAEVTVAMVIFLNFVVLIVETDYEASAAETPTWVIVLSEISFWLFFFELVLRIVADGYQWVERVWNWVDAFIVLTGVLEYIFTMAGTDISGVSILRILRLFRLLRLIRVFRLFGFLKELRTLLSMMGTCFKTLFWSSFLLGIIMSIWAIMAVEVLNPLVQDLADMQTWEDCPRCRRAFSSVFMANLTFFQTIVAGDSWGKIAVPVIEAHPHTAVIFVGAMLTLIFGILNLILAVVVETCAQSREKDVSAKSAEMLEEELAQKRELTKMFSKIDNDASNAISWEELRDGALRVKEFRQWLRVMDIDAHDLRQLFDIVDEDGSGEIDADEFIDAMYRMRNADAKTASKFSKHLVTKISQDQQALRIELQTQFATLLANLEKDEDSLRRKLRLQEVSVQQAVESAMKRATAVTIEILTQSSKVSGDPSKQAFADANGAQHIIDWATAFNSALAMKADAEFNVKRPAERIMDCKPPAALPPKLAGDTVSRINSNRSARGSEKCRSASSQSTSVSQPSYSASPPRPQSPSRRPSDRGANSSFLRPPEQQRQQQPQQNLTTLATSELHLQHAHSLCISEQQIQQVHSLDEKLEHEPHIQPASGQLESESNGEYPLNDGYFSNRNSFTSNRSSMKRRVEFRAPTRSSCLEESTDPTWIEPPIVEDAMMDPAASETWSYELEELSDPSSSSLGRTLV